VFIYLVKKVYSLDNTMVGMYKTVTVYL